jgi:hypothetical protein
MDFEGSTLKYFNSPDGSGERTIEITYPTAEDGSFEKLCVPENADNEVYQDILKWVAEGNTIEEAD